jgi:predicted ATPase
MVFRRFLSAFATSEHPLALFLDDLQWLDTATLELLTHLMIEPEARYLLLIGAYRDNDVSPSHPLVRTFDVIRKAGGSIQEIKLLPLGIDNVRDLLADSLRCAADLTQPLAELVHEKTGGNPFFAIQFLTALAEERDLARIRAKGYTDNVVDLVAGKLNRLPRTTQEALGQLASLGSAADIATLALVQGEPEEKIKAALWEAVCAELVVSHENVFTFLHNRVQEAAYALIPESDQRERLLALAGRGCA